LVLCIVLLDLVGFMDRWPPWLSSLTIAVAGLVLMLGGMWISGGRPALKLHTTLEDYQTAGLLEEAHFIAGRWFEMEEHSDEGLHYSSS
jgi:hypothetical protein